MTETEEKLARLAGAVRCYIDADPQVKGECFRDMQETLLWAERGLEERGWPYAYAKLRDRLEADEAELSKVERTADGVAVHLGMTVHFWHSSAVVRKIFDGGEYGPCVTVCSPNEPDSMVPLRHAYSISAKDR